MNTFINWLGSSFAPKVAKAMDKKIIRTLSGALMANVPILLLGSIISIYNLLAGYVSFLPDLSPAGLSLFPHTAAGCFSAVPADVPLRLWRLRCGLTRFWKPAPSPLSPAPPAPL